MIFVSPYLSGGYSLFSARDAVVADVFRSILGH